MTKMDMKNNNRHTKSETKQEWNRRKCRQEPDGREGGKWNKRTRKPNKEEREDKEHKTDQEDDKETEVNMIHIEETTQQRQEQANRCIWKKVGEKTIITGTTYRKKNDRGEKQFFDETDGKQTNADMQKKQHIIQDDLEYADDTQLLMGNDTRGQMCERLGNYDIVTESRHLVIQWVKVELLRRENARSANHYRRHSAK